MKKSSKRRIQKITLMALLTALSIIIGWFCKLYFTFGAIRITFENLPIILSGIALGPVAGAAVGAATDIISALLSGYAINPLITVGAAAVGLVAGIVSYAIYNRKGYLKTLAVTMSAHCVGTMMIKTFALWQMGYAFQLCLLRIPTYLLIATVESYLIYYLMKNKHLAAKLGGKRK